IVIIGAGAAGLEAARELESRGHSPLILEARDRLGGRIFTHQDRRVPLPIDLGAEFIHGEAPVTTSLLTSAGLSAMEIRSEHAEAHRGILRRTDYWSAVDGILKRIRTEGPDESIADFLARRPGGRGMTRERALTRRFVEGFHAADPERISAQSIATGEESASDSAARLGRVTQGYGALVEWLARGLTIRRNCQVTTISWKRGRATITGRLASGRSVRYDARVVLITVPVALLRAVRKGPGAIEIRPMPPRVRRALQGFEVGPVVRMVVWFRELPWNGTDRPARRNFVHLTEDPFQVLWSADPVRWPLAVAWCGGPDASPLSELPRAKALGVLRGQLSRALGISPRRLERMIRSIWWHDWNRDPYARGAYTYARVGGGQASEHLSRPEGGTLFFAGEATDSKGGTVEAALASGRRAALQIHRSLRRA
ncbi:MAG TPA: NAD(P)/FAD-dependent oxidoreductase, partial [Candidatus Eisenbacteria bacterium]|nr:NAD(P)/FAD-dependent oxidoreductase [Candidatus Eisenbacteria bacterium]